MSIWDYARHNKECLGEGSKLGKSRERERKRRWEIERRKAKEGLAYCCKQPAGQYVCLTKLWLSLITTACYFLFKSFLTIFLSNFTFTNFTMYECCKVLMSAAGGTKVKWEQETSGVGPWARRTCGSVASATGCPWVQEKSWCLHLEKGSFSTGLVGVMCQQLLGPVVRGNSACLYLLFI